MPRNPARHLPHALDEPVNEPVPHQAIRAAFRTPMDPSELTHGFDPGPNPTQWFWECFRNPSGVFEGVDDRRDWVTLA